MSYIPTHAVLAAMFATEQLITAAHLGTDDNRPAALDVAVTCLRNLGRLTLPYDLPEAVKEVHWRLDNTRDGLLPLEELAEALCSARYELLKSSSMISAVEAEVMSKMRSLDRNTYLLSTDKVEPLVGKAHDMVTVAQRSVSRSINHLSATLLGPKVHKGVVSVAMSELIKARNKEEKYHINLKALQRLLEEREA